MGIYTYVATTEAGKRVTGTFKADSEDEVLSYINEKGWIPLSIRPYVAPSLRGKRRSARRKHSGIKLEDYLFLARQMAVMIGAGVPLLRVLGVLKSSTNSRKMEAVLQSVQESVSAGWSLEKAMSKHPDVFDKLWLSVIRTGEATGELARILRRLADHIEKQASFVKKVTSALVYPAFLLVASIGVILFLSMFVVPRFKEIFQGFGQDLPEITKMVIGFSEMLRNNGFVLILGLIVLVVLFRLFLSSSVGKALWDRFVLEVPFISDFVRLAIMENVSANLAILTESGVPILTALEIVAESTNNYVVSDYLLRARSMIREGAPLAVALEETGFFDPIVTQMISVGEEVGEVAEMLDRVAKYYEEEMDNRLVQFTSLLEPIVLVLLAGIVGVLVASIFIPIFRMASLGMGQ